MWFLVIIAVALYLGLRKQPSGRRAQRLALATIVVVVLYAGVSNHAL